MAQDGVARRDDARPASPGGADEPDDADPPFRRAGMHLFAGRIFFKGVSDLTEYATEPTAVSLDAGQDTRAEWAAARARCHPYGSRAERGRAAGTLRAIGTAQALTLRCRADGALVHMQAARRRARAEGRDEYEAGDGCGSRRCSRNFRPAQFLRGQASMADGLEYGARFLIEWPTELGAREVTVLPARTAVETATMARAAAHSLACPLLSPCVQTRGAAGASGDDREAGGDSSAAGGAVSRRVESVEPSVGRQSYNAGVAVQQEFLSGEEGLPASAMAPGGLAGVEDAHAMAWRMRANNTLRVGGGCPAHGRKVLR